jgi:hypothetical protein
MVAMVTPAAAVGERSERTVLVMSVVLLSKMNF